MINFSILRDGKLFMLNFFFYIRGLALGSSTEAPNNVVDSANGIPSSYVYLEWYLLLPLPNVS